MRNIVPFKIFESDEEEEGKLYPFDELSKDAQKNAIENIRDGMYQGEYGADDIPEWTIDDDYLFEPPHTEMVEVFGPDYDSDLGGKPLIGNDRESIYFNSKSDRSYYLHCKKALDINDHDMFLGWLGITPYFWDHVSYYFSDEGTYTKIYFEYDEDEIKPHLLNTLNIELEKAESNFENHLSRVLDSITKSIESEFEDDDRIIDRIDSQEILFDKEGNPEE